MEKIAHITEFRDKLTDYLNDLENGYKIKIYKGSRLVGVFVPSEEYEKSMEMIRIVTDPDMQKEIKSYLEEKESVKPKSIEDMRDTFVRDIKERYGEETREEEKKEGVKERTEGDIKKEISKKLSHRLGKK